MTRARKDVYLVEVEMQSAGDLETEATGAALVIEPTAAVDISSIRKERIARTQSVGPRQGALVPSPGLWHTQIGVTLPVAAEGSRVAYLTTQAAHTALSHLLSMVFQNVTRTTGAAASGSPTTTSVIEGTNDAHLCAAPTGATSGIGMALFEYGNGAGFAMRPYTYDAGTDTMTLLMALPQAPVATDVIYGGLVFQYADQLSSLPYPGTVRFLTGDTLQNRKLIGAWSGLSIPAIGPEEAARFEFSLGAALGATNFADSAPTAVPQMPRVLAGGSVIINSFGETDANSLAARVDIKVAGQWLKCSDPNAASGLYDVVRGVPAEEVVLTIPHDVIPTGVGGSASAASWEAILESPSTYPGEELWHLLYEMGQHQPGAAAGLYFPKLTLVDVGRGEADGLDAVTLTMRPAAGLTTPTVIGCLS